MSFPKVVWQLGPPLLERKTLWPRSLRFWYSFAGSGSGSGESGAGIGGKWFC
jgi:hypothetical protein